MPVLQADKCHRCSRRGREPAAPITSVMGCSRSRCELKWSGGLRAWSPLLPLMGPLSYPSLPGWGSRGGKWGGSFASESSFLNCAYADLNPEIRVSLLGVRTATSAACSSPAPGVTSPASPTSLLHPAYLSPALMWSSHPRAPFCLFWDTSLPLSPTGGAEGISH